MPIINPGELHTGAKAIEAGWRYRVMYAPVDFIQQLANEVAGQPQALPWFEPGVIRDLDLAQRLARAHRLLEADADPLAAEAAMLDALSTLLVRYSGNQTKPARLAADDARVATMKERLTGDLADAAPAGRTGRRSGTVAVSRRTPFHPGDRPAAARVAQPGPAATRAGAVARGRLRHGGRRGQRLHRSEPFHAAFPAHVRRAAGTLAGGLSSRRRGRDCSLRNKARTRRFA